MKQVDRDFTTIMFFAFRYALGRRSTAPSFVQDYIKQHIDQFEDYELEQIIDEIDSEAKYRALGDPNIDKPMWRQFQRDLVLEICRRSAILNKNEVSNERTDRSS